MPERLCPFCQQSGFIRAETVIKAGYSYQLLYCGRCDRTWQSADVGSARRGSLDDKPEPSR